MIYEKDSPQDPKKQPGIIPEAPRRRNTMYTPWEMVEQTPWEADNTFKGGNPNKNDKNRANTSQYQHDSEPGYAGNTLDLNASQAALKHSKSPRKGHRRSIIVQYPRQGSAYMENHEGGLKDDHVHNPGSYNYNAPGTINDRSRTQY